MVFSTCGDFLLQPQTIRLSPRLELEPDIVQHAMNQRSTYPRRLDKKRKKYPEYHTSSGREIRENIEERRFGVHAQWLVTQSNSNLGDPYREPTNWALKCQPVLAFR